MSTLVTYLLLVVSVSCAVHGQKVAFTVGSLPQVICSRLCWFLPWCLLSVLACTSLTEASSHSCCSHQLLGFFFLLGVHVCLAFFATASPCSSLYTPSHVVPPHPCIWAGGVANPPAFCSLLLPVLAAQFPSSMVDCSMPLGLLLL